MSLVGWGQFKRISTLCLYALGIFFEIHPGNAESPYERTEPPSRKIFPLLEPASITPHGLGPWAFDMTLEEAKQKSVCTKNHHSLTALGTPSQEVYLFCRVLWNGQPDWLQLDFRNQRLRRFYIALWEDVPSERQKSTLGEGVKFWRQLHPGATLLQAGSEASRLYSSSSQIPEDMESFFAPQEEAKKKPSVSLSVPQRLGNTYLVLTPTAVKLSHEQSPSLIVLTPSSITPTAIGPWRMGMSHEAVLQNPTCYRRGGLAKEQTHELVCPIWLPGIGAKEAFLSFANNRLHTIQFKLHLEEEWASESSLVSILQQALPFVQTISASSPSHVELRRSLAVQWLAGPQTPAFLAQQVHQPHSTVSLVVASLHPVEIQIHVEEKQVWFVTQAPEIALGLTLLTPSALQPGHMGSWKEGMSLEKALQQPGCTPPRQPLSIHSLPDEYSIVCTVMVAGFLKPSFVKLDFFKRQLSSARLLLFGNHIFSSVGLLPQAILALHLFQQIPNVPLPVQALEQKGETGVRWLPDTITPAWMSKHAEKTPAPSKASIEVRFKTETPYKGFALWLDQKDEFWLLQNMLAPSYPGVDWSVERDKRPFVYLSASTLQRNRLGPWFLGMPQEEVLQQRACQEEGRDSTDLQIWQMACTVWVDSIGLRKIKLMFRNKRLFRIALPLHTEETLLTKRELSQQASPWLNELRSLGTSIRMTTNTSGQTNWSTREPTMDWITQQLFPQEPTGVPLAESITVATVGLFSTSLFWKGPGTEFSINIVDPATEANVPPLSRTSFSAAGIGPWKLGMTLQQAAAQLGCQGAAWDQKAAFPMDCQAYVEGMPSPTPVLMQFQHGRIKSITVELVKGPLAFTKTSQQQATFAAELFDRIAEANHAPLVLQEKKSDAPPTWMEWMREKFFAWQGVQIPSLGPFLSYWDTQSGPRIHRVGLFADFSLGLYITCTQVEPS